MPSTEDYIGQAESYKNEGNTYFQQQQYTNAIQCYTQGIVTIDRIVVAASPTDVVSSSVSSSSSQTLSWILLKWTLLSNRALARIKQYETTTTTTKGEEEEEGKEDPLETVEERKRRLLMEAIDDCQTALTSMSNDSSSSSSSTAETNTVRVKLLYRSARARFLLANHPSSSTSSSSSSSSSVPPLLSEAAQDLLRLLQMDPKHKEGNQLMSMIRTQHQQSASTNQNHNTPVGKVLSTLLTLMTEHTTSETRSSTIRSSSSSSSTSTATATATSTKTATTPLQQQLKALYGFIQNDPVDTSRQLGRFTWSLPPNSSTSNHDDETKQKKNGIDLLWHIIVSGLPSHHHIVDTESTTTTSSSTSMGDPTTSVLGMQCIRSLASQYPIFVRTYLSPLSFQSSLTQLSISILHHLSTTTGIATTKSTSTTTATTLCDLMVAILSVWHSIILHADRDSIPTTTSSSNHNNNSTGSNDTSTITGTTHLQYPQIISTLSYALQMGQYYFQQQSSSSYTSSTLLYRAVMDIVSVFLASTDRDHRIRMSLLNHTSSSSSNSSSNSSSSTNTLTKLDPELEPIYSPQEIRNFTPQQLAAYKKRQYDIKTRNEAWAYERAKYICTVTSTNTNNTATTTSATTNDTLFQQLLNVAVSYCNSDDIIFRREITISISRILSCLEPDTMIQDTVRPYLQNSHEKSSSIPEEEPYIEEIYNDDDDDGGGETKTASMEKSRTIDVTTLETKMIRAVIATAILLMTSKKECATWVLSADGWTNVHTDVTDLITSQQTVALCYVVEMIQAAAVLETTRTIVTGLISSGSMESLMKSSHRDVRSGAAAAIAKLGLSDKVTSNDDGELMGLLQAACALFEDRDDENNNNNDGETSKTNNKHGNYNNNNKYNQYSSYATSSVERAVEMITYLVAHTTIKDEIAAGFGGSSTSSHSGGTPVIELLVQAADQPAAGESMSGFSLASIFQLMAATNEQIRREAFEGKEVTMEQYDEMQRMGKTEEEKEIMEQEKDTDTKEACQERIRKMAHANVPRALVALTENASEHTLEQLTMAMSRMADEASVRGIMIQQGVLSTCIKIEKAEGPTETDIMKKVIRTARHCIAKMLITTNPSLLTSAQKIGAVKPLISLIRDIRGSDLQHFEALLAITNIGSSGDDAKNRIVSERGISTLHFAMFSDHEMVRQAATEAMCNLVPHETMMDHLAEVDHLRLWLAFAADYEDHYECARAAAGCLAMATQEETIAQTLVGLDKFKIQMTSVLESGRLEIMHRAFVIVHNLVLHGSKIREAAVAAGLITFCRAYIELQQHGVSDDEFTMEERNLIPVTVEIAKSIVRSAD